MFCEVGRLGAKPDVSRHGKPWFCCRRDPGNSTGKSGLDGTEFERGRVGIALCTEADLGHPPDPNAGERSISLKIAMRLDVELTRRALYDGEDRGLVANCWWSGGIMVRLEGRFFAFWASLQQVSEYTVTTLRCPAAARCMLPPTVTTERFVQPRRRALPAHHQVPGFHAYLCLCIATKLVFEGINGQQATRLVIGLCIGLASRP